VAGWAVGLFNIFLVVRGKGHFFRSLSITCSIPNFRFFFSQQLAVAETRFRFLFFPIFSARWQLLNPTPFSFSEPQVAVAETDTVFLLFTEFRNSGSCGCRNRFFFLSKYSAIRLQLVLSES
jgi:hypothetical protein